MNRGLMTGLIRFYRDLMTYRPESVAKGSEIVWNGQLDRELFATNFLEPFLNATKQSYLKLIEEEWGSLPLSEYVE